MSILFRIVVLLLNCALLVATSFAAPISEQKAQSLFRSTASATYTDQTTGMEFVLVKGGCFVMGDLFGDGEDDEKTEHEVCVDDFYMGKYEVTQDQYRKITGNNPSKLKRGKLPVENMSWNDAQNFIHKLNKINGQNYRLPTEAEWEYAARSGGKPEKWAGTNNKSELEHYAWYGGNKTHTVGQKEPNGLGLFDMSGNVWEWCSDWYDKNYYSLSPHNNPHGPSKGSGRVIRGGSASSSAWNVRTADRFGYGPSLRLRYRPGYRYNNHGFRLLLPVSQ